MKSTYYPYLSFYLLPFITLADTGLLFSDLPHINQPISTQDLFKMSKVFVVFGATGQQGGALLNYILKHPEFSKTFHLRAITRHASSPVAEDLKRKSVEVVEVYSPFTVICDAKFD
jgi:hypothetical protein